MDKRIEKTLARAREAALDVLARSGFADYTMDAVAAHSGISKSTLYRHWPDRIELLSDALETLNTQPPGPTVSRPGELRERVIELLTHLASVLRESRITSVMPALIEAAEHHSRVASFLYAYSASRRRTLIEILRQGVENGELARGFDPELASLALSGPFFYCRLMSPDRYPQKRVAELVDFILGRAQQPRRK